MSTLEELKDALRDTLAARGSLGQIQARVRAEIFNALEETDDPKPTISRENLVLNELIRDYLDFNGYKHSLSVFIPEAGQPSERINRTFLSQELGIREAGNSRQLPLLYSVLAKLQHSRANASSMAPEGQAAVVAEAPLELTGGATMRGERMDVQFGMDPKAARPGESQIGGGGPNHGTMQGARGGEVGGPGMRFGAETSQATLGGRGAGRLDVRDAQVPGPFEF